MGVKERLAELIKSKRWSQSDLARELGEHRNWVGDRLRGDTDIKADELPRIANALGVSPCAFFEDRPATAPERVYAAVLTVLREDGVIPPDTAPAERQPAQELTSDQLRRFLESLPTDQRELVREIARKRRELREREIPPEGAE